jgi:hypothetical protein
MPLLPKTTQIQSVISRVKEELERRCFRHLTLHGQGFLMIKYQLLKIYSFSTAGPQSLLKFLLNFETKKLCYINMVEIK